jgi:hypothetical protein
VGTEHSRPIEERQEAEHFHEAYSGSQIDSWSHTGAVVVVQLPFVQPFWTKLDRVMLEMVFVVEKLELLIILEFLVWSPVVSVRDIRGL